MSSNQTITDEDEALWKRYVETYNNYLSAGNEFNAKVSNKVAVLKNALRSGDSKLAIKVAELLEAEDLKQLFEELLGAASYSHGGTGTAQKLILSLPREWLLTNIEVYAEPFISSGDYEVYWALLTLYSKLDRDLTQRLAQRAVNQENIDIREAGEAFLTTDNSN